MFAPRRPDEAVPARNISEIRGVPNHPNRQAESQGLNFLQIHRRGRIVIENSYFNWTSRQDRQRSKAALQ